MQEKKLSEKQNKVIDAIIRYKQIHLFYEDSNLWFIEGKAGA